MYETYTHVETSDVASFAANAVVVLLVGVAGAVVVVALVVAIVVNTLVARKGNECRVVVASLVAVIAIAVALAATSPADFATADVVVAVNDEARSFSL